MRLFDNNLFSEVNSNFSFFPFFIFLDSCSISKKKLNCWVTPSASIDRMLTVHYRVICKNFQWNRFKTTDFSIIYIYIKCRRILFYLFDQKSLLTLQRLHNVLLKDALVLHWTGEHNFLLSNNKKLQLLLHQLY